MGTSTSTGTLTAGQSRTFNLSPASAVTLTLLPNARVTITESPAAVTATGLGGNATRVHEPRLPGTFTYGPYPMGGSVLVENGSNSGSSVAWVETSAVYTKDSSGNVTGLVGPAGDIPLGIVHRNLWAQFSATTMCADDGSVLDLSGSGNHAVRGAQLSIAEMNATAGYFATDLAGSNGDQTMLTLPSINFDFDGGEILLVVALLNMAAPAADASILANAGSSSRNGFRLRGRTTGYIDFALYSTTGAVSSFSGNSINVMLDSTLHQFGILVNGRTGGGSMWEDGALTRPVLAFTTPCDTRESYPLSIGANTNPPTVIAHTSATKLRGLVVMRWGPNDPAPTEANLTALMAKLRRDPGRLVVMGDV